MELTNEFTVDVPIDEAWAVLTDVTRIAPCMPGAKLQEVDGDEYRGSVKVKVGPVTAEYKGKATFLEQDVAAHRAVLRAEGRETRGQGNANATITATLEPAGSATRVSVVTDLAITGRVAQFGRGVLADVSNKLLGQFVESLESTVLAGTGPSPAGSAPGDDVPGSPGEGPGSATIPGVTEMDSRGSASSNGDSAGAGSVGADREVVAVNLVRVVGPILVKRLLAPLAALVAVLAIWRRKRRRDDA